MDELIEKLKECKDQITNVKFDDETTLEAIVKKTQMYMSKIIPQKNSMLVVNQSMFYSNSIRDVMFGSNEREFRIAWEEGKKRFCNAIDSFIEEYEITNKLHNNNQNNVSNKVMSNDIFIIHGHNNEMKLDVARVITQLGLNPIILSEQTDGGRTIIEKFEHFARNSSYAIALLSPDDTIIDKGFEKGRARQNVIFELGYFTGLLGRSRTFALVNGSDNIELMSDYQGILHKTYDSEGAWKLKLTKELKAAGYNVTADSL